MITPLFIPSGRVTTVPASCSSGVYLVRVRVRGWG